MALKISLFIMAFHVPLLTHADVLNCFLTPYEEGAITGERELYRAAFASNKKSAEDCRAAAISTSKSLGYSTIKVTETSNKRIQEVFYNSVYWTFNDSYIPYNDSAGYVNMYTPVAEYSTGDQRQTQNGDHIIDQLDFDIEKFEKESLE